MSLDNLMGYVLSIYRYVYKIPSQYPTQFKREGHFHFFRIWSSAKPRPMKNDISQSLGLDLDNINVYAEVYQYIPVSSRYRAIFTFSEFGARQNLERWYMSFCNSLILSEFEPRQKLNQSQMSLTISWGTSCQYQCVCKISSQYSAQFKR